MCPWYLEYLDHMLHKDWVYEVCRSEKNRYRNTSPCVRMILIQRLLYFDFWTTPMASDAHGLMR